MEQAGHRQPQRRFAPQATYTPQDAQEEQDNLNRALRESMVDALRAHEGTVHAAKVCITTYLTHTQH